MSEAFEAFKCIPVIDQVYGGKVECVDFFENSLYIGTSDGNMLLYNFEEASTTTSGAPIYRSNLHMRQRATPTRNPVEQIVVIGPLSKLVVLCDGNVTVHNANTLEQTSPTALLKGGTRICTSYDGANYKLCVATRRKLHLFKYVGQFLPDKQLVIPDTAVAMVWSGHHICVGYKREYLLLHDDTGETKDIFPLDRQTPLIKLLPSTNELLLRLEKIGVIMGFDIIASRPQVQWSYTPLAVGHSFPYVIALLKKTIEVHNLYDTSSCVQTIPLQGGKAIADNGHRVFVATASRIYTLEPIPYEQQIKQLVQNKRVEDAIDLLQRQEDLDDEEKLHKTGTIHIQAGFVYFHDLDFTQSMRHFNQCEIDPREILAWFPLFLPSDYHFRPQYFYPREDIESLVGLKLREREQNEPATMQRYMAEAKECVMKYLENIRQPHVVNTLEADERQEAQELQEAIDTVLLKMYADLSSPKLDEFADSLNHCVLHDCDQFLVAHKRYNAMALLFKQRHQDIKALDMWSKLGSEDVFDSGHDGVKETVAFLSGHSNHVLVMQYSRWVLQKEPDAGLKIFTTTSRHPTIPPDEVLDHLRSYKDILSQQYLEHLVHVECTVVEKYHTQLAMRYLEILLSANPVASSSQSHELSQTKQTLLKFLEDSAYYDVSALLSRTQATDMFEERVVLFKKAKQHYQALRILVYNLKNTEKAEAYCHDAADADECGVTQQTVASLLLILLKVYLSPPSGSKKMLDRALKLLEERAKELDPVEVLKELPANMPIKQLRGFLDQAIPHHVHRVRHGGIVKSLATMESMQVHQQLIKEKSRRVVITDDRICPVAGCRRKIGSAAFGVLPNSKVTHYMCLNPDTLHICPVTNYNFETRKKSLKS